MPCAAPRGLRTLETAILAARARAGERARRARGGVQAGEAQGRRTYGGKASHSRQPSCHRRVACARKASHPAVRCLASWRWRAACRRVRWVSAQRGAPDAGSRPVPSGPTLRASPTSALTRRARRPKEATQERPKRPKRATQATQESDPSDPRDYLWLFMVWVALLGRLGRFGLVAWVAWVGRLGWSSLYRDPCAWWRPPDARRDRARTPGVGHRLRGVRAGPVNPSRRPAPPFLVDDR